MQPATTAPHATPTVGPQTPHETAVNGQTTVVTPSVSPMPKPVSAQLVSAPKVDAARNAPATFASPVDPPQPSGPKVSFTSQINQVVSSKPKGVDVLEVNKTTIVRPGRFDFVDYDLYRRPFLFNPMDTGLTFRYFYDNAFREAFVAPGARLVLDAALAGVYPFTVVGLAYLASGLFNGGAWIPPADWVGPPPADWVPPAPPAAWDNVYAYVPAVDQTVAVDRVTLVGHDESKPVGSQDTMMLNGSTLAWGQVNDARDGGQVSVAQTQPTPGVGPVDDGQSIVLTSKDEPATGGDNTKMWLLGGILVTVVVTGGAVLWTVRHPKDKGHDADSTPTTLIST